LALTGVSGLIVLHVDIYCVDVDGIVTELFKLSWNFDKIVFYITGY